MCVEIRGICTQPVHATSIMQLQQSAWRLLNYDVHTHKFCIFPIFCNSLNGNRLLLLLLHKFSGFVEYTQSHSTIYWYVYGDNKSSRCTRVSYCRYNVRAIPQHRYVARWHNFVCRMAHASACNAHAHRACVPQRCFFFVGKRTEKRKTSERKHRLNDNDKRRGL